MNMDITILGRGQARVQVITSWCLITSRHGHFMFEQGYDMDICGQCRGGRGSGRSLFLVLTVHYSLPKERRHIGQRTGPMHTFCTLGINNIHL